MHAVGWRGTSALRDAQYLPYIVFKSFARTVQRAITYDFSEIPIFFFSLSDVDLCQNSSFERGVLRLFKSLTWRAVTKPVLIAALHSLKCNPDKCTVNLALLMRTKTSAEPYAVHLLAGPK